MGTRVKMLLLSWAWLLAAQTQAANLVTKNTAEPLYAKADKKATVLQTLVQGTVVKELGRKGMFWEVELTAGKRGFVSVLAVKRQALSSEGSLAAALRSAVQQGRREDDASNTRNRSAVMGVRGLDDTSSASFAGNVKPNPRLVFLMENYTVSASDVQALEEQVSREVQQKMQQMTARMATP